MYKEYIPNPIIVDKAVNIWKTWMCNPKYDNLGLSSGVSCSPEEAIPNLFASSLAERAAKACSSDDIEKFGECLRKILLEKTEFISGDRKYSSFTSSLHVDYDPCQALLLAAEQSNLKRKFPWKTSMYIGETYLSYHYGYGTPTVYVYPLKDGTWFEASLTGSDIEKVISLINAGVLNNKLEKI